MPYARLGDTDSTMANFKSWSLVFESGPGSWYQVSACVVGEVEASGGSLALIKTVVGPL